MPFASWFLLEFPAETMKLRIARGLSGNIEAGNAI
jgi:hypothetical protein